MKLRKNLKFYSNEKLVRPLSLAMNKKNWSQVRELPITSYILHHGNSKGAFLIDNFLFDC